MLLGVNSFAQTWTANDYLGNPHDISDHLNAGKKVIVDVSTHWCGPCWTWHTSHIMEELFHDFGPDGTNELFIYLIDADDQSSLSLLQGASGSQGDWITGTPYPIIGPNGEGDLIGDVYGTSSYPTLYLHCGASPATVISRDSKWEFWDDIVYSCGTGFTGDDATLLLTESQEACVTGSSIEVDLYNAGSTTLTSASIELRDSNGNLVHTEQWTGSLSSGEREFAVINYPVTQGVWKAKVVLPNGVTDPRPNGDEEEIEVIQTLTLAVSSNAIIEILTDYYANETSWELLSSNGTIVASDSYGGGASGGGPDANMTHTYNVVLVDNECYSFKLYDSFGDGMNTGPGGSSSNSTDLGYRILDSSGVVVENISTLLSFGYEVSSQFQTNLLADTSSVIVDTAIVIDTTIVGSDTIVVDTSNNTNPTYIEDNNLISSVKIFPNPTAGNAQLNFELVKSSSVQVQVVNMLGKNIYEANLGYISGNQTILFNNANLEKGVCLVRLLVDGSVFVRRLIVLE